MKQQHASRHRRLTRFAWMVALVVVLRVVAWDLHLGFDLHDPDEQCQVCLVLERGGDGVIAATGKGLAKINPTRLRLEQAEPYYAFLAPCPLPRGPPAFLV
jgi:hypothetical protein